MKKEWVENNKAKFEVILAMLMIIYFSMSIMKIYKKR
jgi:hypothetical protein